MTYSRKLSTGTYAAGTAVEFFFRALTIKLAMVALG
jgi:hypothetical protein